MKKLTRGWLAFGIVFLVIAASIANRKWRPQSGSAREEILSLMPADASTVLFLDFAELRHAPFIAQLYAWAPQLQADPEYAQFIRDTGFDYERDLDRIAIATEKRGQDSVLFAIADGKFDRQRVSSFALKDGTAQRTKGNEVFSVPASGTTKKISFAFLQNNRIALTNDSNLAIFLEVQKRPKDNAEWHTRFERLAGSPLFAVIKQDSALGSALAARAPGGLRSPQLSILLDQLQWITIAGKPDNDRLRIVAEGECLADATVRQLTDVINGVLILAEGGLNDVKTRQQLDPAMRGAYLDLLKSADVSKIDRGDSKSVRLVFDLTPGFLEAVRKAPPIPPDAAPSKPLVRKAPASRKGRT